ncbi:MAG: hypothetical protein ACREHD_10960 [Pirellulales bacterium]
MAVGITILSGARKGVELGIDQPAGTPVEVEYRYAADGTLSVRARVASARRSSFVEIHRDGQRQLEDLETWRRRLCGG